jgi:hypothetical protein
MSGVASAVLAGEPAVPLRSYHPDDVNEPLLKENKQRWCMFPLHYDTIWEFYKKAEASFWTGKC